MFIPTSKTKYKVTLNWYGELHILYTYAHSEAKAKAQIIKRFSTSIGRDYTYVRAYYNKGTDNIKIEEV